MFTSLTQNINNLIAIHFSKYIPNMITGLSSLFLSHFKHININLTNINFFLKMPELVATPITLASHLSSKYMNQPSHPNTETKY